MLKKWIFIVVLSLFFVIRTLSSFAEKPLVNLGSGKSSNSNTKSSLTVGHILGFAAIGVGAGILAAYIHHHHKSSSTSTPSTPSSNLEVVDSQSSGPLFAYTSTTSKVTGTKFTNEKNAAIPADQGKVIILNDSDNAANNVTTSISQQVSDGSVQITGDTCSSSVAGHATCQIDYQYTPSSTPVGSSGIEGYSTGIGISASNQTSVLYTTTVYHMNSDHFILLPTNMPNYKLISDPHVKATYVDGSGKIYAATEGGLSISTDGGVDFTNKTTAEGLGNNIVRGVYADGNGNIYAATEGGLSISTDGGTSFTNKTIAQGLGSDYVSGVYVDGSGKVYAATDGGLSISIDGGTSFINKTTAEGLGSNVVYSVYVDGSGNIYAATLNGLATNFFNAS